MDASIKITKANPFDFAAIKTFDISKSALSLITLCCFKRETNFYANTLKIARTMPLLRITSM